MKMTLEEEKATLGKAVDDFAAAMKQRLFDMVDQGKDGWDEPSEAQYVALDLEDDALEVNDSVLLDIPQGRVFSDPELAQKKCLDIANRAMMLYGFANNPQN